MFTTDFRDQVRDHVVGLAEADDRVTAGAVVGSLALSDGDRWSDLDLTFAVVNSVPIRVVLEEWTHNLAATFGAIVLFDLPHGASIYRVFLLPGCLQLDISFTPASSFGAMTPQFRLLFGESVTKPHVQPQPTAELFGYAVHHALRARICIERGRYWQAEYWISATRDYALSLACLRLALPAHHGRGFDDLPESVRVTSISSLVKSLDREELLRALKCAIEGLLSESEQVSELASRVEPHLRHLAANWDS